MDRYKYLKWMILVAVGVMSLMFLIGSLNTIFIGQKGNIANNSDNTTQTYIENGGGSSAVENIIPFVELAAAILGLIGSGLALPKLLSRKKNDGGNA